MAKCWNGKGNRAIVYHLQRLEITKSDLGRLLNYTKPTLHQKINNPYLFTLHELSLMSGLFGVPIEEFVYCLARNKPKVKTKKAQWFIQDVRVKADKVIGEIEKG